MSPLSITVFPTKIDDTSAKGFVSTYSWTPGAPAASDQILISQVVVIGATGLFAALMESQYKPCQRTSDIRWVLESVKLSKAWNPFFPVDVCEVQQPAHTFGYVVGALSD